MGDVTERCINLIVEFPGAPMSVIAAKADASLRQAYRAAERIGRQMMKRRPRGSKNEPRGLHTVSSNPRHDELLWASPEMQRMKERAEQLNAEPAPVIPIKRARRSRKAAA